MFRLQLDAGQFRERGQEVDVSGQVTGNISATDKVELKTQCRMVGDIKAPRILIADGASFKGNVDMDV